MKKSMKSELEKFSDSVYLFQKGHPIRKINLQSLNDYSHFEAELHHYIEYSSYSKNEDWYKDRNIQQKLILMPKKCHYQLHEFCFSDEEFETEWEIPRWKLLFNKKHTEY